MERLDKGLFSKERCGPCVVHGDKGCRRRRLVIPFILNSCIELGRNVREIVG